MKRLYEVIDENIKNPKYPMHMPGAKRLYSSFGYEKYDFTEIEGLDNLQNPQECIAETCKSISKVFKADYSLILVNGSTSGLLASVLGSVNSNETVLVGRNCHQSVLNAIYLGKLNHKFIFPEISEEGIVTRFSLDDIENAFKKDSSIKAMVITSPTYEGVVLDILEISKITKKYNITLIVDEAHGAYFIDKNLPTSAIELGADVIIQSLHKTLPCPTQTALIHINKTCLHKENIKKYLNMIQTTSPSYFFMYIIDKFISDFENNKLTKDFDNHFLRITNFRKKSIALDKYGVLELVSNNFKNKYNVFDLDICKLVFIVKTGNGLEISDILRKKYKIELEMANNSYFIAMTSIADLNSIFDEFFNALLEISKEFSNKTPSKNKLFIPTPRKLPSFKLCDIDTSQSMLCQIDDSLGKICASNITPYPPCVPYLVSGEQIEATDIIAIKNMIDSNVTLLGVEVLDNKIYVKVLT